MNYSNTFFKNILGGTLLVSGCCIGAGMLALPVFTGPAGFAPSLLACVLCWLFMLATGLLLLELNLWMGQGSHIVSLSEKTLGKFGKIVSWLVFLFLFYCLMVAYVSSSIHLLKDFFLFYLGKELSLHQSTLLFLPVMGCIIYLGTKVVDGMNRLLMLGLVVSYCILVFSGISMVNPEHLEHMQWAFFPFIIPIAIVGFGYHQLIPTLVVYYKGDVKILKRVLFFGSLIPLLVYILWEYFVLGVLPLEGEGGLLRALEQEEPATRLLARQLGHPWLVGAAQGFAFFAIVTSFLGVALSFVDFFADGFKKWNFASNRLLLCAFVLLPPALFSVLSPSIFLTALSAAGGLGASLLFGLLPPVMLWKVRYREKSVTTNCMFGGRAMLLIILGFAIFSMVVEGIHQFGDRFQ